MPTATAIDRCPAAAYRRAHAAARELCAHIKQGVGRHAREAKSEGLDWGHVGDMNEVCRQLRKVVRFLGNAD